MAAYPGTLLFALLDLETAEFVHVALHHLLLLAGLYLLARQTGASSNAAAVAAATVGSCGVAWSATTFLNVLASLSWAPWAVAIAAAAPPNSDAARRRAVGAGAVLGLCFLAGEPVVAALAALALAVCVIFGWSRSHVPWALLAIPAAAATAAPVLVPLLSLYPETVRGSLGMPPGALAADALAPRRLVELVLPNALGAPLGDAGDGFWAAPSFPWQRYYPNIFVGSLTMLLLPLAWRSRRTLRPWWSLVIGASAAAAALGVPAVGRLAEDLPGVTNIRFSIKLLVAPFLALAPLTAAGWDRLSQLPRKRVALASAALLVPTIVLASAGGPFQQYWRVVLRAAYPESARNLVHVSPDELRAGVLGDCLALAVPPLVLLAAGPAPALAAGAAFAAGWVGGRGVWLLDDTARWATPPEALRIAAGANPVVAVLAGTGSSDDGPRQSELQRFWAARSILAPGYGTRWGARYVLTRGPDGLEPLRQELVSARAATLNLAERARLARALGATLLVADSPVDGWHGKWVEGAWIGTRTDAVPEAYLARRLLPAGSIVAAVQSMAAESFRPGMDAVIEGKGGAQAVAGGTVSTVSTVPHHRRFELLMEGNGFFVLQQSYLAAWRATIDGRDADVEVANGALIGVRVPAGAHSLDLFLSPTTYGLGACGPLLLLAAVSLRRAVAAWRGRRRSSGDAAHSIPASQPAR
jgi:hypothetical protein